MIRQISKNIWLLPLGMVNAFAVTDPGGITLVDTGMQGSAGKILALMTRGGLDPGRVRQIVLTHCHPDHSGSAAALSKLLSVPVYAHRTDAVIMEQGRGTRPAPEVSPGLMNQLIYHLAIKRAPSAIEPIVFKSYLSEGDELPIAGGLRVIDTPGHSAGHIVLHCVQERLLIAGDLCANMSGPALSIVYEDRAEGIRSIKKALLADFDKAVFGHGKAMQASARELLMRKFNSY